MLGVFSEESFIGLCFSLTPVRINPELVSFTCYMSDPSFPTFSVPPAVLRGEGHKTTGGLDFVPESPLSLQSRR